MGLQKAMDWSRVVLLKEKRTMEQCKFTEKEVEYWDYNNVRRTYTIRSTTVPQSWPMWAEPDENGYPMGVK